MKAEIKHFATQQAAKHIGNFLNTISENNVRNLLSFLSKMNKNPDRNWTVAPESVTLVKTILSRLNKKCREKLITNLVINTGLIIETELSLKKKEAYKKEYGIAPPSFLLINPTMRCNYNCIGCYTGKYTKDEELDFATLDKLMNDAKEIGIYFMVVSGGEPFINPDLLKLAKKHNDMYFLCYSNGSLINKEMAKKIADLGNIMPCISIEGYEEQTDYRRGKGAFSKVMAAMDNLRDAGVLFGYSATATQKNSDIISSEKFVKMMADKGCSLGWYFQCLPVGKDADVELMPTPEQRNQQRINLHKLRNKYPIFIADFWNDGPFVGGCIACGRTYLSINSKGDVEPCGFVHFAVDNIHRTSLKKAIASDFFKEIRKQQPYNENLLMPCMIIDKPEVLRNACAKCHAHPTHAGAENIIKKPEVIKFLDRYSKKMHKITDKEWEKNYKGKKPEEFMKKEI